MKKADLYLSLTCVALGVYASYLIPLLPLSVISKVTILILSSFAFSSVALLGILVSLDTWPTTRKRAGSNRLRVLAMKEKEIADGNQKKADRTSDWQLQDQWEELRGREESIGLTKGTDILFPLINPLKENHNV